MGIAARNMTGTVAIILVASIGAAGDTPLIALSDRWTGVAPADAFGETLTPSIQSGAGLAACLTWTDGCVICRRVDDGIACSTPGIACQSAVTRCVEAAPPPPTEKLHDTSLRP